MIGLSVDESTLRLLRVLDTQSQYGPETDRPYLAAEAVRRLGPLAPWWLTKDSLQLVSRTPEYGTLVSERMLETAASPRPEYGLALITCVWVKCSSSCLPTKSREPAGPRLLRPAVVLPVRWVPGRSDDPCLPRCLLQVAEQVRQQLDVAHQGLTWAFPEAVDARDLPLDADSAFFTLAAALRLAQHGEHARPDPTVWVTAAWDMKHSELREVNGIHEKIATMLSFGGRQIFVPAQNFTEAKNAVRDLQDDPAKVRPLELVGKFDMVLRPILAALRLRPDQRDGFDALREHYCYLTEYDDTQRKKFYREDLLAEVIRRCRANLSLELQRLIARNPILVTAISYSPELIVLAQQVFSPSRVILMVTSDDLKPLKEAEPWLRGWRNRYDLQYEEVLVKTAGPEAAFRSTKEFFGQLVDRDPQVPIIVDITPGQKLLTVSQILAAPQGVHFVYLTHRLLPTGKAPDPGTERYELIAVRSAHNGIAESVRFSGLPM